ncbi:hypothetical protein [Streptomyces sp. 5-10]|uniref:hypothetical protein n=1 Tax=Streptomyces sp. 5-10 TaxID=878925 RepID=UPI00168A4320|nr:hypothetical protein [Streptomyces sp. 5-10]MBD3004691.1 hypothetical protein [Streptomyces sp. 5-10]
MDYRVDMVGRSPAEVDRILAEEVMRRGPGRIREVARELASSVEIVQERIARAVEADETGALGALAVLEGEGFPPEAEACIQEAVRADEAFRGTVTRDDQGVLRERRWVAFARAADSGRGAEAELARRSGLSDSRVRDLVSQGRHFLEHGKAVPKAGGVRSDVWPVRKDVRLASRQFDRDRKLDQVAADAETVLWEAGYDPLEDYPGKVGEPWHVLCLACGEDGDVRLAYLKQGAVPSWDRCRLRMGSPKSGEEVARMMRDAGWEPLEPYPRGMNKPWRCRCTTCGRESSPRPTNTQNGARCASCSARAWRQRKLS